MYARLTLCLCLNINHLYSFVIYLVASEDLCTNIPSASGQPSTSNVPSASGQPSASLSMAPYAKTPKKAPSSKSSKMTKVAVSLSGGEFDMMEVPPEVSMSFLF